MTDVIITFETAKLAKEKGFSEDSTYNYNSDGELGVDEDYHLVNWNLPQHGAQSAPNQSLLQKWLRDKHDIWVYCKPTIAGNLAEYNWESGILAPLNEGRDFLSSESDSYEKVLEEALFESLKLVRV